VTKQGLTELILSYSIYMLNVSIKYESFSSDLGAHRPPV
jgi:hypothetical protein